MPVLRIKDLKKTYKSGLEALKGIDLTIEKGDFYGLLGPNGAGKSTTIGIICSLVNKTSGSVEIAGHNIDTHSSIAKRHLGVVPQEFNFNIFEYCEQIIVNQAGYYGVPRPIALKRAETLLKQLELWDKRYTPARELSGGLKRRLMIARALVHDPEILILDEPTAGVDISLRRSMWDFIQKRNEEGLTVILTTHYLEEAESLCKNIAIIDKGTIIENCKTEDLLSKLHSETIILYCDPIPQLPSLPDYTLRQITPNTLEVDITNNQTISDLITTLNTHNIQVHRFKNKANRLEEMFMKLVKQ